MAGGEEERRIGRQPKQRKPHEIHVGADFKSAPYCTVTVPRMPGRWYWQ